jgi:translation initiation factor IF-2
MAEDKMMRLSLVAKKTNIGLNTIVEHLNSKGFKVDANPNTKLNFEQLSEVAKHYKTPELLEDAPAVAAPVVEPSQAEKNLAAETGIAFFREEPAKPAPTPAPEPTPAPVAEVKPEPVVVPKPEPVVEVKPEPVVEAPKAVEKPVEKAPAAPVAPAEPELIRAEAKVDGLKIIGKIDLEPKKPAAPAYRKPEEKKPAFKAPAPAPAAPVAPKPAPAPAPVVEKKPEPAPEPEPEIELIEAKAEALRGLKVLGKIELPVEQGRGGPGNRNNNDKKKRKRIDKPAAKPVDKNTQTPGAPGQSTESKPGDKKSADNRNNNFRKPDKTGNNRNSREEVTEKAVSENIKATMNRMGGGNSKPTFGAKERRDKRKLRAERTEQEAADALEAAKVLKVTEFISASDLASMMDVSVNEVISVCMQLGMFVSINQRLDAEAIAIIAEEFEFGIEFVSAEEEIEANLEIEEDAPEDLVERAPIVTIMGHVDHGKTSLLDYIRKAKVAAGEAGGITQHIGAYSVKTNSGKKISFLDTPGHEAFTAMRARGAKVTDVVIIVIAADDAVMPTTKEAINHALVAGVPIVFAFSKIDKPGANTDKIREQLSAMNLLVESWGGKYQEQEISSKSGLGIDELLDKVLLESEILELKANPKKRAHGVVIEASLDKGRGYLTTVLVEAGTLKVGDMMLAGAHYGRVKAMFDHLGNKLKSVGPSMPALILGLSGAPQAGDKLNVLENEREAREVATKREQILREQNMRVRKHITLEEIGRRKAIGTFKELNLIVKGDVDGSVEALSDSLLRLSTDEIAVRIIHKGVGQVSESDVLLASTSDAIIVAFQVRPSANARKVADAEQIEIKTYSIIYQAIEEIKDAMEGLLAPTVEEVVTANIEIREVFKISKVGTVAGCYVLDGLAKRSHKVRVLRDFVVIHEGEISALKRFKDDVAEVKFGYECGLSVKNYHNLEIGDIIECYELKEIKRKL